MGGYSEYNARKQAPKQYQAEEKEEESGSVHLRRIGLPVRLWRPGADARRLYLVLAAHGERRKKEGGRNEVVV